MNQFWILFAVFSLFFHRSMAAKMTLIRKGRCEIDPKSKSSTMYNLKNNCNNQDLQHIFSNLTAGPFPLNGKLKGHVLLCPRLICGLLEGVWNGKNIKYKGGNRSNDHGIVSNTMLRTFDWFKATIYRTKAPIDGKEAFAIDYKRDLFVFFIVDYIRKVQNNLYLGIATFRGFEKYPVVFFLLEAV